MQNVSLFASQRTEALTGALSYCKPAAARNLKTAFSCSSASVASTEESQSAELQLLTRPLIFCKHFSRNDGTLVLTY